MAGRSSCHTASTTDGPYTYLSADAHFVSNLLMQPCILVNRFIINLRQINTTSFSTGATSDMMHFSRFSTPNFSVTSHFLGNIGAELEHREYDDSQEASLPSEDRSGTSSKSTSLEYGEDGVCLRFSYEGVCITHEVCLRAALHLDA